MRTRNFGAPGAAFGFRPDLTPVVRQLLLVNVVVWGLQVVVGWIFRSTLMFDLFALDPGRVLPWRPWQFVTYMFLHSAPAPGHSWTLWHLVMNSLFLAFLGGPVERRLGSQRFLRLYLYCGLVGGLLTLLPPFRAITVGASGAVMGVLTAFAVFYPNLPIYVLFLFAVPAKYLVLFLALLNVLSAANATQDGIAYVVHLGGMATAFMLLRGVPFGHGLRGRWMRARREKRQQRRAELRRTMDEILDKMHREGKESLTQEDWNVLLEESRRLRDE